MPSSPFRLVAASFVLAAFGAGLTAQTPVREVIGPARDPGQIAFDDRGTRVITARVFNTTNFLSLNELDRLTGAASPTWFQISDPDGLDIDSDGLHTGQAGAVVIGHHPNNLLVGQITALYPSGTSAILHGPSTDLANAGKLLLNQSGEAFVQAFPSNVPTLWRITPSGQRTAIYSTPTTFDFDLTSTGNILLTDPGAGNILEITTTGTVVGTFGAVQNPRATIAAGIGGAWPARAYLLEVPNLYAVDSQGPPSLVMSGFDPIDPGLGIGSQNSPPIAFGPDGALYVSTYRPGSAPTIDRLVMTGGTGQANRPASASLEISGIGATGPGPFHLVPTVGSPLVTAWRGAPGMPYFLALGELAPTPLAIAGTGLIEIDTTRPWSFIIDASGPAGFFARLGPSGASQVSFSMPALLGTPVLLQGLVMTSVGPEVTASFLLEN